MILIGAAAGRPDQLAARTLPAQGMRPLFPGLARDVASAKSYEDQDDAKHASNCDLPGILPASFDGPDGQHFVSAMPDRSSQELGVAATVSKKVLWLWLGPQKISSVRSEDKSGADRCSGPGLIATTIENLCALPEGQLRIMSSGGIQSREQGLR